MVYQSIDYSLAFSKIWMVIFVNNAQFVETVRDLCKSKQTSLTKLEAQLGFSNGYIGKWAKRPSSPPHDKLVEIANALGVTVEELTGEQKEPTPAPQTEIDADLEWVRQQLIAMPADKRAALMQLIKTSLK